MEENKEKDFTVRDRRIFSSDSEGEPEESQADQTKKEPPRQERPGEQKTEQPLPEPDFPSFILSLAASAQMNLGVPPHLEANQPAQNLPAAKQIIDILGMLKEKTRGNLDQEEEALIDGVLYNLRMLYIKSVEMKK